MILLPVEVSALAIVLHSHGFADADVQRQQDKQDAEMTHV